MEFHCDVLVVGAGIHGAGVAQAAAAAGFSVTVLEQSAVAAGTSSRSSKLIHGGLRYLEGGRLQLVRESLRERETLLRIAPDLVRLIPFHIPIYKDTSRSAVMVRAGLALYALLGGLGDAARFHSIPKRAWDTLDGLDTAGLKTVFRYFDAQTDDAALTRAVLRSAQALDTELLCPARLLAARRTDSGIEADYEIGPQRATLRARALVNAAGPWVNRVLALIAPAVAPEPIELVQGSHLVLRGELAQGAYYVEAPHDQRAVFVVPWRQSVLVGTTETSYAGDPGKVSALPEEIEYLRTTARRYFPALAGEPLSTFAGLRVLPRGSTNLFRRSRETILRVDDPARPRIVTIYGGKLTGYRITAARVIDHLAAALPARRRRADTAELPLTGT